MPLFMSAYNYCFQDNMKRAGTVPAENTLTLLIVPSSVRLVSIARACLKWYCRAARYMTHNIPSQYL